VGAIGEDQEGTATPRENFAALRRASPKLPTQILLHALSGKVGAFDALEFAPMRVLVVADADWVRSEVAAASSDFELIEETDPSKAVAACGEASPDVVLVDLQVGSMGGVAVTRDLRDAILARRIDDAVIVLLLDRGADEFIAGRSGADAWLVKPFTPQQLRSVLTSVPAAD